MSLDLTLESIQCKECGHAMVEKSFNYTYNASKMWYEMFPEDEGMVKIEGMTGQEAQPKLLHAIKNMRKNKEVLKLLEPTNGWGSYEGFLSFLRQLYKASQEFPSSVWRADR